MAVLTSMLNRTRSRSGFRSSVRSSLRRAVIAASRPVSKLMSPVSPASSIVTCPLTRISSPFLVTVMVESEMLRRSSGAS